MKRPVFILFILLLCIWMTEARAQINFSYRVVKDNLFIPWQVLYGPDGHLWLTQKNGYICRLDPFSGNMDTLRHEAEVVIRGEGGMLGMAMHPDFEDHPYVYVAYNYLRSGVYTEKVVRYTYTGQSLTGPLVLLDNIGAADYHNGCRLLIADDMLYITTGDATNASVAQDPLALNGKVLRIGLDGSIPADNPLPGSPVWAWGIRNAQGLALVDGKLYTSEHGPNNDDEFNLILKGRNYGWPEVEGYCDKPAEQSFCNDSNVAEPLMAWTPTLAVSAIAGYGTGAMFPQLHHSILMATLKGSRLYRVQLNAAGDSILSAVPLPGVSFGRLRSVCIGPDGRIFLSTSNSPAHGNGAFTDRIIELFDPGSGSLRPSPGRDDRLQLYPNPAGGSVIHLHSGGRAGEAMRYAITDIHGRTVGSSTVVLPADISIDGLPAGMYFLRGTDARGRVCMRSFVRF